MNDNKAEGKGIPRYSKDLKARVAYLILAHNNPDQLRRLVQCLCSAPESAIFVHIDLKSDIGVFEERLADLPVVFVAPREKVFWGGWTQIRATMLLMKHACSALPGCMRYVLLSGDCAPLLPVAVVNKRLLRSAGEIIALRTMPDMETDKPMSRLEKRFLEGGVRARGVKAAIIRLANVLLLFLPARDVRAYLGDRNPYAGSQWWALTAPAARLVLHEFEHGSKLKELFQYSKIPDESFVHTIVGNSRSLSIESTQLMFADWSDPSHKPALLSQERLVELRVAADAGEIDFLFARKMRES